MPDAAVSEPPRPARQRLSRDERRDQIIEAATALFQKRPYGDVSLDEIAEHIGVARALINHHFGTKHDLYLEVVRHVVSVDQIPIPDYVDGATMAERAAFSLDGWLDNVERNPEVLLAAIRASGSADAEVAAIVEQARENVAARFIAILGLGPASEVSPQEMGTVRAWAGLGEAATVQWIEYGRLSREQVRELIIDAIVRGATQILEARKTKNTPKEQQ